MTKAGSAWDFLIESTYRGIFRNRECCVIAFMLTSLPFSVITTITNHKNEELYHPFDSLVIGYLGKY